MNNKTIDDIQTLIEHCENNVDSGGSFSNYVLLINGIKELCLIEKNRNILTKQMQGD
jgi:hypothetical protein|tara:strand:+ start:634 stop:804 length:171 start_codon:yes stop_codon:yes gene_type:complete